MIFLTVEENNIIKKAEKITHYLNYEGANEIKELIKIIERLEQKMLKMEETIDNLTDPEERDNATP